MLVNATLVNLVATFHNHFVASGERRLATIRVWLGGMGTPLDWRLRFHVWSPGVGATLGFAAKHCRTAARFRERWWDSAALAYACLLAVHPVANNLFESFEITPQLGS